MAIRAWRFSKTRGVRLFEVRADSMEELQLVSQFCHSRYYFFAISGDLNGSGMIPRGNAFDLTLRQIEALPKELRFDMDCSNPECLYHELNEPKPSEACPRCGHDMQTVMECFYLDGILQYNISHKGDENEEITNGAGPAHG